MVVVFVLRFKLVVRVDRIISVLKTAATERKFGTFIVDPLSVTALIEENTTLSSSISTTKSTTPDSSSGT